MSSRSKQNKSPSPSKGSKHVAKHWSQRLHETIVFAGPEGLLSLVVQGGAENGQFCYIGELRHDKINYHSGKLHQDEVVLEIQGEKVAGYTLRDLLDWLKHVSKNGQPVMFKTVKSALLPKDLRLYLNTRFEKNSLDHELQQKIRDNVYKRTVPCTTRVKRSGELDGVDYKFLTVDEFLALEKSGNLLESGLYDGNHYGTPKPSKDPADNPFRRTNSMGTLLPGQHPSSEGKRRRNRSNIETSQRSSLARSPSEHAAAASPNSAGPLTRKKSLERAQSTTSLGPLPPNWEMSFTEEGVPYFIDHRTETTHWLDPRLVNNQKLDPLKCNPDELPYGWEKVEDSVYGTYYIDHVNRKTQYENPVLQARRLAKEKGGSSTAEDRSHPEINGRSSPPSYESHRPVFTKIPSELKGKFLRTELLKSPRGFGFTIVGGEDSDTEFLQIKNVVPNGPAFEDRKLQRGDVLVYINTKCVLGFTHQDVVSIFQTIPINGKVALEICRGYPLPFDPDDPNTEIITTIAVTMPNDAHFSNPNGAPLFTSNNVNATRFGLDSMSAARRSNKSLPDLSRTRESGMSHRNRSFEEIHAEDSTTDSAPSPSSKPQIFSINIVKGDMGFGFTIADSAYGQRVKQILDRPRCKNLLEGDILVEINRAKVKDMAHSDVVQVLKDCPRGSAATVVIQRGGILTPSRSRKHPDRNSPSKTSSSEERSQHSEPTYSNIPRTPFYHPDKKDQSVSKQDIAQDKEPKDETDNTTVIPEQEKPASEESKNLSDSVQTESGEQNSANFLAEAHMNNSPSMGGRSKTPTADSQSHSRPQELRSKTPTAEMMSYMGRGADPPYTDLHNQRPADPLRHGYPANFDSNVGNSMHGYSPPHRNPPPNSVNDFDGRAPHEARFRSRTPGPEFMRGHEDVRRTPEMRSKTPTNDYNPPGGRPTSTISGTPNFIPASHYQNPPGGPAAKDPPHPSRDPRDSQPYPYHQSSRYNSSSSYSNSPNLSVPSRTYNKPRFDGSGRPLSPSVDNPSKQGTSFENEEPSPSSVSRSRWGDSPGSSLDRSRSPAHAEGRPLEMTITLHKHESGFGFRIIGGTEEGSQVSVGYIVPGGCADVDGRLRQGDEILYAANQCVIGYSHHKVVQMMGHASNVGQVTLSVRRRPNADAAHVKTQQDSAYPYDVTVTRRENEGFGFIIISSVTRAGSVIGKIIDGSPAERCGALHVGDRILSVNHVDISQMHHEEIVSLIKVSGHSVTLTIGPPQARYNVPKQPKALLPLNGRLRRNGDDASSTTSNSQRAGSTTSSLGTTLTYPTQSESDLSRRSEYSPYHNTQPHNRTLPHQPVLDKQRELKNQRTAAQQPDVEEDKFYAVELHRGSRGFGFSFRGGKEFDNMPLFVLRIADGGAANLDGRLRVGDQILEINGYNTNDMTHAGAIELISSGGSTVKLLVKRTNKSPPGGSSGAAVRSPPSNPSPLPSMPNGPLRAPTGGQGSPSGPNRLDNRADNRLDNRVDNRLDSRSPYLYANSGQYGRPNLGY